MATRFYLEADAGSTRPAQPNPSITPAYDAAWNVTTSAARRWLTIAAGRMGTPLGTTAYATETDAAAVNVLARQFVSTPLAAQLISGTVTGQIQAIENATGADARAQMVVKVVSNDGSTVLATLLAADDASGLSSEFSSSAHTNRTYPLAATSPATLSSYTCSDGDRLVVEIGFRAHNVSTSSLGASFRFGTGGTADLAANETATDTDKDPWIEFSDDLTFLVDGTLEAANTEQWLEAALISTNPELRATEEWLEVPLVAPNPELRATEIWLEVAFERDYVYLDGVLVLEGADDFTDVDGA